MRMSLKLSFLSLALLGSAAVQSAPQSFTEAAAQPGQPAAPVVVTPRAPTGTVTIFTERPTFDAAFPGLAIETFNGGNAPAGNFSVCDAPLASAAGDAACGFAPGELIPGISYQDSPGPDLGSLVLLGDGTALNATQALVANTFNDAFDLVLNPPVSAIGMDLISTAAPGQGAPDLVAVSIFDASDVLIDTIPAANASGPGNFLGISSPVPIARISLLSANNRAEGVDNVTFAASAGNVYQPVPMLGTGAWIAMIAGVLLLAGLIIGRRQ